MSDEETQRQYLSFHVAGGEYALEILEVREIIPHGEITPLPRVPDFVRGLINLRGSVVPIVDLSRRLGFEPTPRTKRSSIVVSELELDGEWARIGLLADDVSEVLELGADEVEPAPRLGAPVSAVFLRGVAKVGARFVLVLDVEAVVGEAAMRAAWAELADAPEAGPLQEDPTAPPPSGPATPGPER